MITRSQRTTSGVVGQSADEMQFNVLATSRSYVDWVQVAILELAASALQCVGG